MSEEVKAVVIIVLSLFYILAGIKYWSAPPSFHVPVSKYGKIAHRICYCTLGLLGIISAIVSYFV